MTREKFRQLLWTAALSLIVLTGLSAAPSAHAGPVTAKREPAPHVRLADWYGTADAVQLDRNGGVYALRNDAGRRAVVLEGRSIAAPVSEKIARRTPILRATGWYRLATVPPRGVPAVGQWTRSTRYNAKQFRLCRIGIPGRGKVCTAYSGIIVAL